MHLKAISDDKIREELKKGYYVVLAFSDEDTMDVFMHIANRNNLKILANGTLKHTHNRLRRFVYDYTLKNKEYRNKPGYKERQRKYAQTYYRRHKFRLNEDKRFKRLTSVKPELSEEEKQKLREKWKIKRIINKDRINENRRRWRIRRIKSTLNKDKKQFDKEVSCTL